MDLLLPSVEVGLSVSEPIQSTFNSEYNILWNYTSLVSGRTPSDIL